MAEGPRDAAEVEALAMALSAEEEMEATTEEMELASDIDADTEDAAEDWEAAADEAASEADAAAEESDCALTPAKRARRPTRTLYCIFNNISGDNAFREMSAGTCFCWRGVI